MNSYNMDELIPLVAALTEKYTSKESSSISYDKARQLMGAVIYCINENVLFYTDNESAEGLNPADKKSAATAYKEGYDLVIKKVLKTKMLYEQLLQKFLSYGNRSYQETVIEGLPVFFLKYDPKFNPQDHILTLDYPTLRPNVKLSGVDCIYQYVNDVSLEQTFLNAFPKEYVVEICRNYHPDFKKLFINVGSLVLRNSISCMIAGRKITSSQLSAEDCKIIAAFAGGLTKLELENKILCFLRILIKQGHGDSELLFEYLQSDVKDYCCELRMMAKRGQKN